MEASSSNVEWQELPYDQWTDSHVSSWLRFIKIKENYIEKLAHEEVTGPVLMSLHKEYFSTTIGMKSGPIEHLLRKRDELLQSEPNKLQDESRSHVNSRDHKQHKNMSVFRQDSKSNSQKPSEGMEKDSIYMECEDNPAPTGAALPSCDYRKFDEPEQDCKYVKHHVLPAETGVENMIVPCHEYKSLEIAHKLDSKRLQTKVASEVLRFACACMNMRSNGTIHFGIMDKIKGGCQHGEIIGIPVENKEDFVDALDYIEKCFKGSNQQCDARKCIRNPRFIEVLDKDASQKTWVIEYDVVSKASIVKDKLYSTGVPKFSEEKNKVILEDKVPYHRVGANTPRILEDDLIHFIQGLREKDQQREEAESSSTQSTTV
ncbi:sterile alpha motif domain-containing protein 9-like [Myripristis murdjan]|uniref:sterile alpha motif domain-containing protein 9-like n=1 Tax=Myripristis murdjan TaxID=586833 RepID=UPI001175D367|nr:sterile alpha motif domain-containing protein 9-like [Myripristis murdjan]